MVVPLDPPPVPAENRLPDEVEQVGEKRKSKKFTERALRPPFWYTRPYGKRHEVRYRSEPDFHRYTVYFGDVFRNDPYDYQGIVIKSAIYRVEIPDSVKDVYKFNQFEPMKHHGRAPEQPNIAHSFTYLGNGMLFCGQIEPIPVLYNMWTEEGIFLKYQIPSKAICQRKNYGISRQEKQRLQAYDEVQGKVRQRYLDRRDLVFTVPSKDGNVRQRFLEMTQKYSSAFKIVYRYPNKWSPVDDRFTIWSYLKAPEDTPHWGYKPFQNEHHQKWIDFNEDYNPILTTSGVPEVDQDVHHSERPTYFLDETYEWWAKHKVPQVDAPQPLVNPKTPEAPSHDSGEDRKRKSGSDEGGEGSEGEKHRRASGYKETTTGNRSPVRGQKEGGRSQSPEKRTTKSSQVGSRGSHKVPPVAVPQPLVDPDHPPEAPEPPSDDSGWKTQKSRNRSKRGRERGRGGR